MPSAFSIPRNFPPYIKWVCQSACKIYHWKPRLVLADCQNVGTITLSIGIKRWRELLVSESRPSFYRVSRLRFYEQPTGLSNATRQIMYLHKYFHTYSLYSFFANGKESYLVTVHLTTGNRFNNFSLYCRTGHFEYLRLYLEF